MVPTFEGLFITTNDQVVVTVGSLSLKILAGDPRASGEKGLGSQMIMLRRAADFWILIHSLIE